MMPETKNQKPARVLIVIPCRNEEGRIGNVVRTVRKEMPLADVVVVDDASTDRSSAEASAAGATVLPLFTNYGYGAALETGYTYAVENKYDAVLQMDGDGQHLASELSKIYEPVRQGEADIVIGSRYPMADSTSLLRRIGHGLFSAIIVVLSGRRFTDPTSGFQAMSTRSMAFLASGVFPCDYPDADVILMATYVGLTIKEVHVSMEPRISGKSMHSGLQPLYYGMKMILSIFIVLLNYRLWRKWRCKLEDLKKQGDQ